MTDREAMQQALESLERVALHLMRPQDVEVMQALRTALEQPEQEPVARCKLIKTNGIFSKAEVTWIGDKLPVEGPLYTTPPAAQRKPLTDAQIDDFRVKNSEGRGAGWRFSFKGFARDIEAAHDIREGT